MDAKGTPRTTAELITRSTVKVIFTDPSTETGPLVAELTELLHKHNLILAVKGKSRIGAPKVNPEGEIVLIFSDINQSVTLTTARIARKWLRKHSLSVTTCRKESNRWIFPKASPAVKLHFKIK